jgi:hypothetical protein
MYAKRWGVQAKKSRFFRRILPTAKATTRASVKMLTRAE